MADAFATAAAAAGVLEQCIRLCGRVRSAVERQKGMLALVEKNLEELQRTKTMVDLVGMEKALQTPNVGNTIARLGSVGHDLEKHLEKMNIKRGRFRELVVQLVRGQRNQDTLEHILLELERTKLDLSMYIQLANVGLTRGVGEALVVSVAAVDAVNKQLQMKLGSAHRLRISKLLAGRPRNSDGTVNLTEEDVSLLSAEPLRTATTRPDLADMEAQPSFIIIRNNKVSRNAIQLNSSIGAASDWDRMATVRIEGNKAMGHGFQLNHPMSAEGFRMAMEMSKVRSARGASPLPDC